jgi:hypothetical protein
LPIFVVATSLEIVLRLQILPHLRAVDTSLGKALTENIMIDEVLPEIQRRRTR